jgi:hypothetical protein
MRMTLMWNAAQRLLKMCNQSSAVTPNVREEGEDKMTIPCFLKMETSPLLQIIVQYCTPCVAFCVII